ncbi:hypothetical protein R2191_000509 [Listeria monocytogenes]|nr:hypothetical protein [Listeria monocytogenes]ELQ5940482.1 hypothetical protein [Listeria monocytogenes]
MTSTIKISEKDKPPFLYILKCQLAVDPDLKNEIREAWKASKVKEVSK